MFDGLFVPDRARDISLPDARRRRSSFIAVAVIPAAGGRYGDGVRSRSFGVITGTGCCRRNLSDAPPGETTNCGRPLSIALPAEDLAPPEKSEEEIARQIEGTSVLAKGKNLNAPDRR